MAICCSPGDREVEYYPSGKKKFEVPVKNGKWNGKATGYFESGAVQGEMMYVDNQKEGRAVEYYESGGVKIITSFHQNRKVGWTQYFSSRGILQDEFLFDSLGGLVDYHEYDSLGQRDLKTVAPIGHFIPDTIRQGDNVKFFVRLGNADSTVFKNGTLFVTSSFDSVRYQPRDTLAAIHSDNAKGFSFSFIARQKGENTLNGFLVFDTENADSLVRGPHKFVYVFDVREPR